VHPKPLPALKSLYAETLTALSALPQSSVYRQGAESFTKSRLEIVDKAQAAGNDIAAAEAALGGMVEVAIEEAQAELKLVGKMGEWKA
jgi:NADH dehydrogenase (ubiquinone) 1 alpha subcomplex subunit 5